MPNFRVRVHGRNALFRLDGESVRGGFFVTRFVSAADPVDADHRVRADLVHDVERRTLNARSDPVIIDIEAVETLEVGEEPPASDPGFAFYLGDDEDAESL